MSRRTGDRRRCLVSRRQLLFCPGPGAPELYCSPAQHTPALFFRLRAKKSGRQDTNRSFRNQLCGNAGTGKRDTRWILTSNAPLCHFTDYFWRHYNEPSKLRCPTWSLDIVQQRANEPRSDGSYTICSNRTGAPSIALGISRADRDDRA